MASASRPITQFRYTGTSVRTFIVFASVAALIGLGLPVSATTTKIEVSGTQQAVGFDFGETWTSGSIQHVRNGQTSTLVFPTSGLPAEGSNTVSFSYNLNLRTGEGRAWGTGNIVFEGGGFETTFTGDISPSLAGPVGVFHVVGHGYGAYEGMQLRLSGTENLAIGFTTFDGILFEPGN